MTYGSSLSAIQISLYSALSADSILSAKSNVYDDVPENTAFPYISFGVIQEAPNDSFDGQGTDVLVTLDIWSRAFGFKEAFGILDDVVRLLHRAKLTLNAPWTNTVCQLDGAGAIQALRDPDGITRHVSIRFRLYSDRS